MHPYRERSQKEALAEGPWTEGQRPNGVGFPPLSNLGIPPFGKSVTFDKRRVVFHHGDPPTSVYWVEHGAVMVQQYLDDGRRQLVEIVLPGGICGFCDGPVYEATGETLMPSVLRICRRAELESHAEMGWLIEHQIERQLCAAQEHALELGRMTAQERVCALLDKFTHLRPLADHARASGDAGVAIQLPMTRGEIGDYLGLSLETVCRTLSQLQRKGIIDIGPHHGDVVIKNLRRLRHLAGSGR